MTEFEREQKAFSDTLSQHSSDVEFAALDPAELRLRASIRDGSVDGPRAAATVVQLESRRRRPWLGVLAAAAALVVAVPTIGFVVRGGLPVGSVAPASASMAGAAAGGAGSSAADRGTSTAKSESSVTAASEAPAIPVTGQAAKPGVRWETMGDAIVQVPASWGYATALDSAWCAEGGSYVKPSAPFVAYHVVNKAVPAIGCLQGVPEDLQVEHVEWRPMQPSDAPGAVTVNGWVYTSRIVGHSFITYVHRPGVDAAALLDSAQAVSSDALGCATYLPPDDTARPAPGSSSGTPDGAVLCFYAGNASTNLVTSARLDAAAAAALSNELTRQADVAGQKFGASDQCEVTPRDFTRTVVRFATGAGTREVWLTFGMCRVPTSDDGVTRRALPAGPCLAAQVGPIVLWYADQTNLLCLDQARLGAARPAP